MRLSDCSAEPTTARCWSNWPELYVADTVLLTVSASSFAVCVGLFNHIGWLPGIRPGLNVIGHGVNINAVAQNYVSNPAYYPDDLVASERFQQHLARNVPIRRVARDSESAELALFLAGDNSDFIVGQVVPFAGGWATNT